MRNSTLIGFAACLVFMGIGAVGHLNATSGNSAHPYHVSLAEIEWNPKTGNFEVSLCVWPGDLEKAVARLREQSTDLDDLKDSDKWYEQYVTKKFLIRGSNKNVRPIRWVGSDINLKKAWLFFEVEGDTNSSQWTLENKVFFELNQDQMNQVQLKIGKSQESVGLTSDRSTLSLKTRQINPGN